MSEYPAVSAEKRNIWLRGLLTLLMGVAYQITSTVLAVVAILQFVFALAADAPNARLRRLGRSLGRYLGQIADFASFATEELPFPFADWPSGD